MIYGTKLDLDFVEKPHLLIAPETKTPKRKSKKKKLSL